LTAAERRARELIGIHRYEEAKKELATALASEPDNGSLYALMGFCLVETNQIKGAIRECKRGITLEPDAAFPHYALGLAFGRGGDLFAAEAQVREAIRLDPYRPSHFLLLGRIHKARGRWKEVLDAADEALKLEPGDSASLSLRAEALSFLGKGKAATEAARQAISQDPGSAAAHVELAWVALRQGDQKSAQFHFREGLRLNPENSEARRGLLESLRSIFPPYRWTLQFQALLARFPGQLRGGAVAGIVILLRLSVLLSRSSPQVLPFIIVPMVVLGFLIYMSLFGPGLLNGLVVIHPLGRLALRRDERITSWILDGFIALIPVIALVSWLTPFKMWTAMLGSVFGIVLLSLAGRLESSRRARLGFVWVITVICAAVVILTAIGEIIHSIGPPPDPGYSARTLDRPLLSG
jgi:tetratricopeptide (TPR) repeat protein